MIVADSCDAALLSVGFRGCRITGDARLRSAQVARTLSMNGFAAAKINLTLDVLGRRPDGFHELRSLVMGVDLCDRIHCSASPRTELECNDPALCGLDNLALRAALKLAERCGTRLGVRLKLEKRIPVGAGLGGGSSDAATVLRLCNHLWQAGLTDSEIAAIGAEIGSDVPLFLALPTALITGRGEHVSPVRLAWSGWVLVVFPGVRVSTADVYRAWRPEDAAHFPVGNDAWIPPARTAAALSALLTNQLEPAVVRVCPAVGELQNAVERLGLGPLRVSGSGSALYRLFDERESATEVAKEIEFRMASVTTYVAAAPVAKDTTV